MDTKIVSLYKNSSIALAFLCSFSVFIDETAYRLGISISLLHWAIFLNIAFIALTSIKNMKLSNIQMTFVIILVCMMCYMLLVGIFKNYKGVTYISRQLLTNIFFFIIIADRKFSITRLGDFAVILGALFSVLSIILYFGYYTGVLHVKSVRMSNGQIYYEGFGGYLNLIDHWRVVKYGSLLRSQSYWSEPALFGQFLQIPLFISLQKVSLSRSSRNIVTFVSIGLAMLLTFSVANFGGIFLAMLCYLILSRERGRQYSYVKKLFKFIMFFVCIISMILMIKNVTGETQSASKFGNVIYKGYAGIERRMARFEKALGVLGENIWGSQEYKRKHLVELGNPWMVGSALLDGGLPLLLLLCYIYFIFYSNLLRTLRRTKYGIAYLGSISFFVAYNVYGSFHNCFAFFQFALFTEFMKHDGEVYIKQTLPGTLNTSKPT